MIAARVCILVAALVLPAAPALVHAASKDAQELMALREKRAPLECELTRLYREVRAAHKAGDLAKVKALTARMHEVDDKLRADGPRVGQLMRRVRNSPDHKAILEQQVKFDKACK
jgi:hypothetical protein